MSRSNDYYDEYERDYVEPPMKWSDILMFPVVLLFMFFFAILPPLVLILYFLNDVYSTLKRTINSGKLSYPSLAYVPKFCPNKWQRAASR
jgi:hypothetical protein